MKNRINVSVFVFCMRQDRKELHRQLLAFLNFWVLELWALMKFFDMFPYVNNSEKGYKTMFQIILLFKRKSKWLEVVSEVVFDSFSDYFTSWGKVKLLVEQADFRSKTSKFEPMLYRKCFQFLIFFLVISHYYWYSVA